MNLGGVARDRPYPGCQVQGEEDPVTDGKHELIWRKSRACASSACVEVATGKTAYLVRDSADPEGASLAFDRAGWASFIAALQNDEGGLDGVER
jgi:hypothetical protein